MPTTKLLSIDPSIANIGYALFEGTDLKQWGTIRSEGEGIPERLKSILSQFDKFEDISHVAIELPSNFTYARSSSNGKTLNAQSMNMLHMSIGAIVSHFAIKDITVEMINPLEWNKKREKKQVTKDNVKCIYNIKVNEHVADAIMMGEYCNYMIRIRRMETFQS